MSHVCATKKAEALPLTFLLDPNRSHYPGHAAHRNGRKMSMLTGIIEPRVGSFVSGSPPARLYARHPRRRETRPNRSTKTLRVKPRADEGIALGLIISDRMNRTKRKAAIDSGIDKAYNRVKALFVGYRG